MNGTVLSLWVSDLSYFIASAITSLFLLVYFIFCLTVLRETDLLTSFLKTSFGYLLRLTSIFYAIFSFVVFLFSLHYLRSFWPN